MFMRMIYDERLAQAAYLIGCQATGEAIVIDPQRDVDRYIELARENELEIVATTETHIHADFLSGCRELAERTGAKVYLSGEGGPDWNYRWLDQRTSGGAYDHRLLKDGDRFTIGSIDFRVMHTPGHTPEHIVFVVTDAASGATEPIGVVSGDFVFVGDLGRPDLLETAAGRSGAMEPAARQLRQSVERLETLPDYLQVWPGHGAGSACGKALGAVPMSTMGYERRFNPAILASRDEAEFVDFILSGQPEPPLYFADMKRLNRDGPPVLERLPQPEQVPMAQLSRLDPLRVAIVDTRPWNAFRSAHICGSLSFPLIRSFNTDVGSMVGRTDEIFLIVDPAELDDVIRALVRIGFDRIAGWCDASSFDPSLQGLIGVDEVRGSEAASLMENDDVQVLDVRRATEFAEGHFDGAMNIAHTRLASRLDELPSDRRLLVNCLIGSRSCRSCALLQRHGFDVVNLAGGIAAWPTPLSAR